MSIELITGKSATAHISANDFRAINRANYGPGRYILKDADNMQTQISAQGTIYIGRGSLMWSGMHIRCEDPTTLKFTPPTTRENIEVYLHYVKDVETLNESVEWVVSVGKELTPIIDNVADNTMEAYTLFCFASMFADGTMGDTRYKFNLLDCHEDFDLSTIEQRIDWGIELKTASYNQKFNNYDEAIDKISRIVVLYNGDEVVSPSRKKISLKDDYDNYKFLIFEFTGYMGGFGSSDSRAHIIIPSFNAKISGIYGFYNRIYLREGEVNVIINGFYNVLEPSVQVETSQTIKLYSIYGVG